MTVRDRVLRIALSTFRHLPVPIRRLVVRYSQPRWTLGAVVVARRDDRILMIRQRHTGVWALPGGLLAKGETPKQAAAREAAEEVGLHVAADDLGTPLVGFDPQARRVDVVFPVDVVGQEPVAQDDPEVLEMSWLPVDALPLVTEPTAAMLALVGISADWR